MCCGHSDPRDAATISQTSSAVPITQARRFQSVPLKATPGNRRVRRASSASDSTTAPLLRRVRLASWVTSSSVTSDRRMLNGSDFRAMPRLCYPTYAVS